MLEAPAGKFEENEDPLEAAKRELQEETGFSADKWTYLGQAYPSPGFCTEILHFYVAEKLTLGNTNFDEDENIELATQSLSEIDKKIDAHEIIDGKTLLAYFLFKNNHSKT